MSQHSSGSVHRTLGGPRGLPAEHSAAAINQPRSIPHYIPTTAARRRQNGARCLTHACVLTIVGRSAALWHRAVILSERRRRGGSACAAPHPNKTPARTHVTHVTPSILTLYSQSKQRRFVTRKINSGSCRYSRHRRWRSIQNREILEAVPRHRLDNCAFGHTIFQHR